MLLYGKAALTVVCVLFRLWFPGFSWCISKSHGGISRVKPSSHNSPIGGTQLYLHACFGACESPWSTEANLLIRRTPLQHLLFAGTHTTPISRVATGGLSALNDLQVNGMYRSLYTVPFLPDGFLSSCAVNLLEDERP